LLPIAQCTDGDLEPFREFLLRQPQRLPHHLRVGPPHPLKLRLVERLGIGVAASGLEDVGFRQRVELAPIVLRRRAFVGDPFPFAALRRTRGLTPRLGRFEKHSFLPAACRAFEHKLVPAATLWLDHGEPYPRFALCTGPVQQRIVPPRDQLTSGPAESELER